jgi:hypothetical protein
VARAARIALAGIAVLYALVAATPAKACSLLESDQVLADELRRSDQVFIAHFVDFSEVSPPTGWRYMQNEVTWQLVEVLKGDPPNTGQLQETNPYRPMHGMSPGPSCGPFVALQGNVGREVLVLLASETCNSSGSCQPNAYSQVLFDDPEGRSASRTQLIRDLIRKEQATP